MKNIYNSSEEELKIYYLSLLRSFKQSMADPFLDNRIALLNGRELPKSSAE